jgi:hypothetical protein
MAGGRWFLLLKPEFGSGNRAKSPRPPDPAEYYTHLKYVRRKAEEPRTRIRKDDDAQAESSKNRRSALWQSGVRHFRSPIADANVLYWHTVSYHLILNFSDRYRMNYASYISPHLPTSPAPPFIPSSSQQSLTNPYPSTYIPAMSPRTFRIFPTYIFIVFFNSPTFT